MRWDLQEHRKSKLDPGQKEVIEAREDALLRRVSRVFQPEDIKPPSGYLDVIKSACNANGPGVEAAAAERLWRTASGAAHGKYWPALELQHVQRAQENESGRYRTFQLPDASAMTEVLEMADAMSRCGVVLYARYSGVDVAALPGEAMAWVAERVPLS